MTETVTMVVKCEVVLCDPADPVAQRITPDQKRRAAFEAVCVALDRAYADGFPWPPELEAHLAMAGVPAVSITPPRAT